MSEILKMYASAAQLVCFDGEGDDPPADPTGNLVQNPPGNPPKPKLFTQDEVDKLMMNHRKGLQKQVEELSAQLEVSKGQDHEALMGKINEMSLSLKTKEEQAKAEQERLRKEAAADKEKIIQERDQFKNELNQTLINHALTSAAHSGDAFNPDQIVTLLRNLTVLTDDKKVMVKGLYQLETGEPSAHEPADAIKWMRDNPEKYGNLFKANVVGGIGSNSSVGGAGTGKPINFKNMAPEQYREWRKKNPG